MSLVKEVPISTRAPMLIYDDDTKFNPKFKSEKEVPVRQIGLASKAFLSEKGEGQDRTDGKHGLSLSFGKLSNPQAALLDRAEGSITPINSNYIKETLTKIKTTGPTVVVLWELQAGAETEKVGFVFDGKNPVSEDILKMDGNINTTFVRQSAVEDQFKPFE